MHITEMTQSIFPIVGLIVLVIGIKKKAIYHVISALWLSLIALIILFQSSGGEILGDYFNYLNAAIYSLNLIVLFVAISQVFKHLSIDNYFKYLAGFFNAFIAVASLLLIINMWTNAYFIENRLPGTPIMQVALFTAPEYCSYRYVFYKIAPDGAVHYLCPNHYGLIPSSGKLDVSPDFIAAKQLFKGKQ